MRISRTHFPVTALGPGTRLGVWVQGCPLACRGCMSQDTWNPLGGKEVPVEELVALWHSVDADGLTVSGGEPLRQPEALREFLLAVRSPDRDILLYTGYELDELTPEQRAAADLADVLITGRYDIRQPTSLIWRGSANQRMVRQTDLGRRRYAAYVDHEPEQAVLQTRVDDEGVWLIGVPRRGSLARFERRLRTMGISARDVSWRS